jgi:Zn-dependent peptidase ImmA (M78 family)
MSSDKRQRLLQAEFQAENLVKQLRIVSFPINPIEIAEQYGISCKSEIIQGFSGCLVKQGDVFGIIYSSKFNNESFVRFTVAHELGHYFLPVHPEFLFPQGDGIHSSHNGFTSSDIHELEADHFAAGLLMPRHLFTKALGEESIPGFHAIEALSEKCKTSITATAIRYATFADYPVALVVSSNNRIEYSFMSDKMKTKIRGASWLTKGEGIPYQSQTAAFNENPNNILLGRKVESVSYLDAWFSEAPSEEVSEDVFGLGQYGKTLTVLFCEESLIYDEL